MNSQSFSNRVSASELQRVALARHHDPFTVLGLHPEGTHWRMTVFRPHADSIWFINDQERTALERVAGTDFFTLTGSRAAWGSHPQLVEVQDQHEQRFIDPYTFLPQLDELWLQRFHGGECFTAHEVLGAHPHQADGVDGVLFAVWAPNAERVSVVGDFNRWDGRIHPMRARGSTGVWELFLPELAAGQYYKFEIRQRDNGQILLKSDPYGRYYQMRPDTASLVCLSEEFQWQDDLWLARRRNHDWLHQPLSVYEMHLGSWRRGDNNSYLNYRDIAAQLVPYVKELGFTHIELMPVTEHPFDGSWGYQVTGYFAPTSRFGSIDDFKFFVDHCHRNGIGVILDWVPAHFPKDAHGLARFDGTALYEHADPQRGEHLDWGTLIFNYGRNEVRNFLYSSAYFWLDQFHIDGLRVDAVASMLYLDYSRKAGEWTPNQYGGNENLDAIHFLRRTNEVLHQAFPGILMLAEESTAWPQVSRPVYLGGLGFSMKWNMGWMNDTLAYIEQNPVYRQYHHDKLTFSLLYAFSENFMLPLSHDEVVHGKRSLLEKMPGDTWQQFANLRLLFTYLFTHPGKKLLFMGGEFGQGREWNHDEPLDWHLLQHDFQSGVQKSLRDLNRLYCGQPELHQWEFEPRGFEWIDCHDHSQSVISFLRKSASGYLLVVLNFTPVVRQAYRIGVPEAGLYAECFNSDSVFYGGSNISNGTAIASQPVKAMGREHSIVITLPPLAGVILHRTD